MKNKNTNNNVTILDISSLVFTSLGSITAILALIIASSEYLYSHQNMAGNMAGILIVDEESQPIKNYELKITIDKDENIQEITRKTDSRGFINFNYEKYKKLTIEYDNKTIIIKNQDEIPSLIKIRE